jgi:hypothetical protein
MNMIKHRKPVQAQPLQDEVPMDKSQADGESEIGARQCAASANCG